MIHPERVQPLNDKPPRRGRYVLYWMQRAQRAECNHALEYAIRQANELSPPLVVGFGLTPRFPEANRRHYAFMLQGLNEVRTALERRGVQLVVRRRAPDQAAIELAGDASLAVADRGYLRVMKAWRDAVARRCACRVVEVETDVVVPVEVASRKQEFAARTIRPRIHWQLDRYLVPLKRTRVRHDSLGLRLDGIDTADVDAVLSALRINRSVAPVRTFTGGTSHAKRKLRRFIRDKLDRYDADSNDPVLDGVSHMSPYLHFGQVSPMYVALQVRSATGVRKESIDAYLEQLIVRRELAINYVHFNGRYDTYAALPEWARRTLAEHRRDNRDYMYTLSDWESARTHDPYWNAAQLEIVRTGRMHNYMRMYWGKKVIEWSATPAEAFRTLLYLNNTYELDGRDPNGFVGVAWCFGLHDRPWQERPVFGKVRYMNAAGLERKFDIDAYVRRVATLDG